MDQPQLKKEMLRTLEIVREEQATFCASLTPKEKTKRGSLQKWSASDVVTHLVFWEEHLNAIVEKGMIGEKIPSSGDYMNQINDGVLFAHIDQPFDEALAQETAAYQKFMFLIDGIPTDALSDCKKHTFLEGRSLLDRTLGTYIYHAIFHFSDYYIKNGQREKALKLQKKFTDLLSRFPEWEANSIYNLACFYSLNDMKAEAIEQLKLAFKEKEDLIEWAKKDNDLNALRGEKELMALLKD